MADFGKSKGFVQSLFSGTVDIGLFKPFPTYRAEDLEESLAILDMVKKFSNDQIDPVSIDREHGIPESVMEGLTELGLWGLIIPEEYDGFGQPEITYLKTMEILTGACASTSTMYGGHMSIGLKAILLFGTDEQKRRILPDLASGEKIAGFALTEAGAGSDAAGITTTAELSEDGKYYVLNGRKLWITNGGTADVFTLFAKIQHPGQDLKKSKISAFVVTRDMDGFSSGKDEEKLGLCGSSTTALFLENVKVPVENLLGSEGEGFKIAMEVLNTGRLALSAGFIGTAKTVIEQSVSFASQRYQFNVPIREFEMIKEKFARMLVNTFTGESMTYYSVRMNELPDTSIAVESAVCKTFNSEALWDIVNECLQIAGGNGYSKEYPYERILRDARVNMIFEGTNEIQRLFIAATGLKHLAAGLEKYIEKLPDDNGRSEQINRIIDEITPEETAIDGFSDSLKDQISLLNSLTREFHRKVCKAVLKHGKAIREKQLIQKRIADSAIDLFGISANILRVENLIRNNHQSAGDALLISKTFSMKAEKRITDNLDSIETNQDEAVSQLAGILYSAEKYPFDILNY